LLTGFVTLLMALAACGGSEVAPEDPAGALAAAKGILDDTPGVRLTLSTSDLPAGVDGLKAATGVGTHPPAFEGTVELLVNDLSVQVPVVAVDGLVFAKLPFTTKYSEIDPAEYGAPDPARLMDPDSGISSWLTAATGLARRERIRDGAEVLTSYSGTLSGTSLASSIPSAVPTSDFAARFQVADNGELRAVVVTGPFYDEGGSVEYTVTLTGYGTDQQISRP
jgi:lipoprotein LprG